MTVGQVFTKIGTSIENRQIFMLLNWNCAKLANFENFKACLGGAICSWTQCTSLLIVESLSGTRTNSWTVHVLFRLRLFLYPSRTIEIACTVSGDSMLRCPVMICLAVVCLGLNKRFVLWFLIARGEFDCVCENTYMGHGSMDTDPWPMWPIQKVTHSTHWPMTHRPFACSE